MQVNYICRCTVPVPSPVHPLACRSRFVRKFLEWFIVDAITHAFVCASHAEPIGVIRHFQASVKHMVAASAAIEHLLTDIRFLRFVLIFWWQQDGGRITTQHREVLVAQIFVYVLVERKGYIVPVTWNSFSSNARKFLYIISPIGGNRKEYTKWICWFFFFFSLNVSALLTIEINCFFTMFSW